MEIGTLFYKKDEGWQGEIPSHMDSLNTLVLVFGGSSLEDDPEGLAVLAGRFPKSKLIGCSTAGEILGQSIYDSTLVASVVRFDDTELKTASATLTNVGESFDAGAQIAGALLSPALRGILILSDGLCVNGSQLVAGINSILPPNIAVTGGLAGDNWKFERTWVIGEGEIKPQSISAVGFYGDKIHIGLGSEGGLDFFGPERKITRSEGNVLYELDGKPALEIYKNYLGDRAAELPSSALLFPLAIRADAASGERVTRSILGVDENAQSMTFAGDIPQGSLAQLMRANIDRLIDGASKSAVATNCNIESGVKNALCISVSCVGRRWVLGERAEEELEAVAENMPFGTTQIGFYSYGEISATSSGQSELHNQTMTVTTIYEV